MTTNFAIGRHLEVAQGVLRANHWKVVRKIIVVHQLLSVKIVSPLQMHLGEHKKGNVEVLVLFEQKMHMVKIEALPFLHWILDMRFVVPHFEVHL